MNNTISKLLSNSTEDRAFSHNITPKCLSNCSEWKLNSSILVNRDTLGNSLKATSYFYQNQESSILAQLQNLDNQGDFSKYSMTSLEKNSSKKNPQNKKKVQQEPEIELPLDSDLQKMSFVEANMGIQTNLENIVLLEFDFIENSISKETMKQFIEINNDYVNKELCFSLNAVCHGKPIFKSNYKFSIEAKKLIKSMQFRLENHKKDFLKNKSSQNLNSRAANPKKTNFFTKILCNQNLGIEFIKNRIDNLETYATNFNSVVKSKIFISKIFLEVSFPNENIFKNLIENKLLLFKNLSPVTKSDNNNKDSFSRKKYECHTHKLNKTEFERPYYYFKNKVSNSTLCQTNELNKYEALSDFGSKLTLDHKQSFSDLSISFELKLSSKHSFNNIKEVDRDSDYINYDLSSKMSFGLGEFSEEYNYLRQTHNHKYQYLRVFLEHFYNQCNLFIFLNYVRPFYFSSSNQLKMNIFDYFSSLDKISFLGIDIPYYFEDEVVHVNYSPTLSSFELQLDEKNSVDSILKDFSSFCGISDYESINEDQQRIVFSKLENNFKITYSEKKIIFSFSEQKPPHNRNLFSEQIKILEKSCEHLTTLKFEYFDEKSWYSILWSPLKSSKTVFSNTSFLVYYSLDSKKIINNSDQAIIGFLPIKFDEGVWLESFMNSNRSYFYENKQVLKKHIENVYHFFRSKRRDYSTDYDFYNKNLLIFMNE